MRFDFDDTFQMTYRKRAIQNEISFSCEIENENENENENKKEIHHMFLNLFELCYL